MCSKTLDLAIFNLAVRRCSHCTSASSWESKAWKFSHAECKSYACTLTYLPAGFYYSTIQSGNRTTHWNKHIRMVCPWPDQPDRFQCLYKCTSSGRSQKSPVSFLNHHTCTISLNHLSVLITCNNDYMWGIWYHWFRNILYGKYCWKRG